MASSRRKNMKHRLSLFSFVFLLLCLMASGFAHACPMCGDILERGKDAVKSMRFSWGIAWSILLMLGVLFSMLGSFVYIIWKGQKKSALGRKEELSRGTRN